MLFNNYKKSVKLPGGTKFAAAVLSLSLLTASISGCSFQGGNESISRTAFYFNTVITISIYDSNDETILDGCMELASKYDNLLSTTVEGSDIWNINHSSGKPVTVDADTASLIKDALNYAALSDGAFDPTIGIVSSLWDFSSDDPGPVPDEKDITNALQHVDYTTVQLSGNTVTMKDADAQLDLGGIAKGYIADKLKEYLVSQNVSSAIINLGGNVLLVGSKPDGTDFTVGIQKPFEDNTTYITTINEKGLSIVSSGPYERNFTQDGKLYHHILDTSTGYPVDNNLYGVTILSDSSVDGDALSTICFIKGLDEGMKYIESLPDTEALFITNDYELHYSSGFPKAN